MTMDWFSLGLERHHAGAAAAAAALYQRALADQPTHIDAWSNLGALRQQAGGADAAVAAYGRALRVDPTADAALRNLSALLRKAGRFDAASRVIDAARRRRPADAALWTAAAVTARQAGRTASAIAAFRVALALDPTDPFVWSDYGVLTGAAATARRAVQIAPDHDGAVRNLIAVTLGRGEVEEASAAYRRLIARSPFDVDIRVALCDARRQIDPPQTQFEHMRRALAAAPDRGDALAALADALGRLGRLDEAERTARRALRTEPGNARAANNLAVTLLNAERNDEAEALLRPICRTPAPRAEILTNLGAALKGLGRLDEALTILKRSLALEPALPQTLNNLGNVLREYAEACAAAAAYRRAVAVRPDYALGFRNLLPTLLYAPDWSVAERYAIHRDWERRMARPLYPAAPRWNVDFTTERRLRIGYLSSDLRGHVVARNVMPIFEAHDRAAFSIHCYADVAVPDVATARFKALSDGWRDILGWSDRAVADAVRADAIDILVCLAGHFDRNRPLVCAHRPAPVQISFHDPVTSGMTAMDYLLADPTLVPRNGPEPFTERVLRLPGFYLAGVIPQSPDPSPPPRLAAGRTTFGCFNAPSKITDDVLRLWSQVLAAVPDSRLILKYRNLYDSQNLRRRFLDRLAENGVAPDRVVFRSSVDSSADHLTGYHEVDIALDPFPFCGSTTTYEALWMGVPVATLAGESMVGRWSASMLRTLKLDGLIADRPERYVAICRDLAAAPELLARWRGELRGRILNSSLNDGPKHARRLERLYRAVWRRRAAEATGG